jgi:prevent-host-death family protein
MAEAIKAIHHLFWSSDQLSFPPMRRLSVAVAKARFSSVLAQVEAGEDVVITRRGVAIARIVAEPASPHDGFDLQELFRFTDAQPMHEGPDGGTFIGELRRDARH